MAGNGMTLAIGAPGSDVNGFQAGRVKVVGFRIDPETGESIWKNLGEPIDGDGPNFLAGRSVALSTNGKTLAVGMPGAKLGGKQFAGLIRTMDLENDASTRRWVTRRDLKGDEVGSSVGQTISLSYDGSQLATNKIVDGRIHGVFVLEFNQDKKKWSPLGDFLNAGVVGQRLQVVLSNDGSMLVVSLTSAHGTTRRGRILTYQLIESANRL